MSFKNFKKGSIVKIVLIVFAVIIAVILGLIVMVFWALDKARKENVPSPQVQQNVEISTTTEAVPVTPPATTVKKPVSATTTKPVPAGWKRYSSAEYGITFDYPSSWTVELKENSSGVTITARAESENIELSNGTNMIADSEWIIDADLKNDDLILQVFKDMISKGPNIVLAGVTALKEIVFNDEVKYKQRISFLKNEVYYVISESWYAGGSINPQDPIYVQLNAKKMDTKKILDQVTASVTIK